jgi:hypothetical protein
MVCFRIVFYFGKMYMAWNWTFNHMKCMVMVLAHSHHCIASPPPISTLHFVKLKLRTWLTPTQPGELPFYFLCNYSVLHSTHLWYSIYPSFCHLSIIYHLSICLLSMIYLPPTFDLRFLMINHIQHHFIYFLAICKSASEKMVFFWELNPEPCTC